MQLIKSTFLVGVIFAGITSCKFNKSFKKDFISGITTKGDGLSADAVYITINDEKVNDDEFYYGQDIITNFENIDGFVVENDTYYPQMEVALISKSGDTVLHSKTLFDNDNGIAIGLKSLTGNVILARPIYSGDDYTLHYTITDKKGPGKFSSELKFNLLQNPSIKVSKQGLSFKEGYLMSLTNNKIITNGKVAFDELILMDFQDISGYTRTNGQVSFGLQMKVVDANNTLILLENDVFGDEPMQEKDVQKGLGAKLEIRKGRLKNPVNFQVTIWDKNSDAKLTAETAIIVE